MPKHIPEEIKLKAMRMYLKGDQSAKQIAEELSVNGVVVSPPTIYAWAKKYDWKSENASMTTKAKEIVKEKQSQRIARLQGEHLDSYEKMRKKAESELQLLDFERAFEAVKAIDIGIQGERKTVEGMINLQFVQDVLNVLVEEITDPDLITKVANRLRTLVAERDDIE